MEHARPPTAAAVRTIAPLLAGAVAAAAAVMLIGWPQRPALPAPAGEVAAAALAVVAVLLVFAPALRPRQAARPARPAGAAVAAERVRAAAAHVDSWVGRELEGSDRRRDVLEPVR